MKIRALNLKEDSSRTSTVTQKALEALENSPVNSPQKPSGTKRSAKHLKRDDEGSEFVVTKAKTKKVVSSTAHPKNTQELGPTVTLSYVRSANIVTLPDGSIYTVPLPDGSTYTGQMSGGYRHGQGKITFLNGDIYQGSFVYNKLAGGGTYTYKSLEKSGEKITASSFVDGKPHGYGTHIFPFNVQYEGPFVNGEKQREGIWSGSYLSGPLKHRDIVDGKSVDFDLFRRVGNGYLYSGQFSTDAKKAHGFGILYAPGRGKCFVGSFRNGRYEGFGILSKTDGSKYIGFFRKGLCEGYAASTLSNGSKCIGFCKNDRLHGHGTYIKENNADLFEDGHGTAINEKRTTYIGEFFEGRSHGHGRLTHPDGVYQEGQFRNGYFLPFKTVGLEGGEYVGQIVDGQCHGYGIVTYPDESQFEGQFVHGKRQGLGTWTDANGTVTKGTYQDGKFFPFETVKFEHCEYVGQIVDGKFHGYGIISYADGSQYEGQFVHGNEEGKGIWTHPDGTASEGRYQDGEFLTFAIVQLKDEELATLGNALKRAYLTVTEPSLTLTDNNMLDRSERVNERMGMEFEFIQMDLLMKDYGYLANRPVPDITFIPLTQKKSLQEKIQNIGQSDYSLH